MKKKLTLDYAVYGKLIVPLILMDSESFMQLIDDSEAGKCLIVNRPGRYKSH